MWAWLKNLFTFPEPVIIREVPAPSLETRVAAANRLAETAIAVFTTTATQLEAAADTLAELATESFALSDEFAQRGYGAESEARANKERAEKIRDLLS